MTSPLCVQAKDGIGRPAMPTFKRIISPASIKSPSSYWRGNRIFGGASNWSLARDTTWPARFVAVHLISPSSVSAAWWMINVLLPLSSLIFVLRLLNISKPSLNQFICGVGVPVTFTRNSHCSFSSTTMSWSSFKNLGAVTALRCRVTVNGSDNSLGSDGPMTFCAVTRNW